MSNYKNIILDFDGVILDSNTLKKNAFVKLLSFASRDDESSYLKFLSERHFLHRSEKFSYYFENYTNLVKEKIEFKVSEKCQEFSDYIVKELSKSEYRIRDSIDFIQSNRNKYKFYIVSAASKADIVSLCKIHGIYSCFEQIYGGERSKEYWFENYFSNTLMLQTSVFIGDSESDFHASCKSGINFLGYNNLNMKSKLPINYLESFNDLT